MNEKSILTLHEDMSQLLTALQSVFQIPCCYHEGDNFFLTKHHPLQRTNFCKLVNSFDTKGHCRQFYSLNCTQGAQTKQDKGVFCPFGLVNIVVPLYTLDERGFFFLFGPFIMHEPDDLLVKNILALNSSLLPRARELRLRLSELAIKREEEIPSLITVAESAARGIIHTYPELQSNIISKLTPASEENTLQALGQWIDRQPLKESRNAYTVLQKELELLAQNPVGDLSQKALDGILHQFMEFVYEQNQFPLVKQRALHLIHILVVLTKNADMRLSTIFGDHCNDIRTIMQTNDRAQVSHALGYIVDRFAASFLSCKNMANREIIFQAMHYIRTHYSQISLNEVAKSVALSPAYLSNLFKRETGKSYSQYLNRVRIEASKQLLRENHSLADVAQRVGFSDQSYFTNVFRKYEGMSPNRWKHIYFD